MLIRDVTAVKYGPGEHLLATNPAQGYLVLEVRIAVDLDILSTDVTQAGFLLSLVYARGQWFIKMSILALDLRLFTTVSSWFRIAV
jgi:hypothetical protein